MEARDLIVGIMAGLVAIVIGVVPGLFSGLALEVRHFGEQLRFGPSVRPLVLTEAELRQRPLGLAVFGALMIASVVLAQLLN